MIITRQRSLEDILALLSVQEVVFIAGCSECATVCRTGGEPEVLAMKEALEGSGKKVSGWAVLEPACNLQNDRRLLRERKAELDSAEVVLSLSCGNGTQTICEATGKEVVGGNETIFLGEVKRVGQFSKNCVMCGDCILEETGGLCPVARCPKHMLNGPCGGSEGGKCEVDRDEDCVWHLIYERKKERGELDQLKRMLPAKDWSKEEARSLDNR
ncbi:MAG: methylenetetrahydrofolate reductase C-terminal domain-containing protein [Candidatus Thermoplasmatota archaeon]|nr:methylenetetrahydrofolate reductase C-terminal domain-containing protein [Candidatus Thermoplasmatota archaeon]